MSHPATTPADPALEATSAPVQRHRSRPRDPFYDVVRALAILRVVAWHTFQWPLLSYIAAMPVMFFVGGVMARSSFERRPAFITIRARLRRLLPSLWTYSAFAWAAFILTGITAASASVDPPWRLLAWVLPLWDPVGPDAAVAWWAPLWYLRAYLWLVLATPMLVRALRRHGAIRTVGVAGAAATVLAVGAANGQTLPSAVNDLVLYGAFWTLGLAARELRAVTFVRTVRVRLLSAIAFAAVGAVWMVVRPVPLGVVNASPMAELLFGAAWIIGLSAVARPLRRVGGRGRMGAIVSGLNRRAVTIYLWHCAAIAIAHEILGAPGGSLTSINGIAQNAVFASVVAVGTTLFVTMAGPIEDAAAAGSRRSSGSRSAAPSPFLRARHPAGIALAALTVAVAALAALPVIDLRNAESAYVPASGRGLDRLINAETIERPDHLTPVVRGEGLVTPDEVVTVVAEWRRDWDMSGVVAAVGRSDGTSISGADGTDAVTGEPMRAGQVIPAHSITKSFTGALIAQLAAEQYLDLDERLAVWVPEFPHASRMSLRQLAQHSSGLIDTGESPAVAIEIAGSVPLKFEPGEGTAYADSAYFLLARAAERATGSNYADLVHDRLLVPLGLHNTTLDVGPRWSAGGMHSTVDDLVRWAPAFWGGGLGEGVADEARTLDPDNNFGIGTFGYCPCDGAGLEYVPQFYGHLSAQGRLAWDPVDDLAVMIHTNEENDGARTIDAWNDLDRRLRQLTLGRPLASPVTA